MRVCNLCRSTERKASDAKFYYPNPDKDDQKDYTLVRTFDVCDRCVDAMLDFIEGSWYSRVRLTPMPEGDRATPHTEKKDGAE